MFTPIETSVGALLLHLGSMNYLKHNGKIFGCSGILRNPMQQDPSQSTDSGTLAALFGTAAAYPLLAAFGSPTLLPLLPPFSPTLYSSLYVLGYGLLTGWGTKAGSGCTSGHMLIGLSRLSLRSLVAVATFFSTALVTSVFAWKDLLPGCGLTACYTPSYPSTSVTAVLAVVVLIAKGLNDFMFPKLYQSFPPSIAHKLVALVSGVEFGLGLLISGMASPFKVLGFFALAFDLQRFDPSLALVILFGIGPNLITCSSLDTQKPPTTCSRWSLPEKSLKNVNTRFVLGAAAFGVAWGLSGACPGPAILRSVAQPIWGALWLAGFYIGALF